MENANMKNISTGTGLALLAGSLLASTVILRLGTGDQVAHAVVPAPVAVQAEPTVVWMGVTNPSGSLLNFRYHRLWSDGRQELRIVSFSGAAAEAPCPWTDYVPQSKCFDSGWFEISPPPSGNGFACRSDLNGDRTVDGADLSFILANWGPQQPCEPEATYPCMTIAGGGLMP
jgi:hypothetical protein